MKHSRLFLIGVPTLSFGFSVHAQSQKSENASATPATANSCPKGTVAQHNHNMERAARSGTPRCVAKDAAKTVRKNKAHNHAQLHNNQ